MRQPTPSLVGAFAAAMAFCGTYAYGQIQAMPPYDAAAAGDASAYLGNTGQDQFAPQGGGGSSAGGRTMTGYVAQSAAYDGVMQAYSPDELGLQQGTTAGSLSETTSWNHANYADATPYAPPATAGPMQTQQAYVASGSAYSSSPYWSWQLMPDGIIYKSYLAGVREPRLGSQWFYQRGHGWLWDSTLGGRVGLLRYGTNDAAWPEGWQLDVEGAAFPRLDMENGRDLVSVDFRFGSPLTFRKGPWEGKIGYYHICSHIGDEYLATHQGATRTNYVRDAIVLGLALRPHPDLRIYGEAGYAVWTDGGAEPWEFQFGAEYSPAEPSGILGAPFLAVNGHLREEIDFSGCFTAQAGLQWRGDTGNLLRLGAHYFNGLSEQYQFLDTFEDQIGVGLWYDY